MWIIFVSSVLSVLTQIHAGGTIYIQLDRYENSDGLAANGHCCDGRWICQNDGCDYIFIFCLDQYRQNANDYSTHVCHYGKKSSREIPNQTNMQFLSHFGGIANPMEFHFDDFDQESMSLSIKVDDVDDWSDNDHVDMLLQRHMAPSAVWQNLNMTSKTGHTRLTGTFRVLCDRDWYGDKCDHHCPPPAAGQYYTCENGVKVCVAGWGGENCDEKVKHERTTQAPTAAPTTTSTPITSTTTSTTTTTTSTTTTTTATTTTAEDDSDFPHRDENVEWNDDLEDNDCDRLAMNGFRYQDGIHTIHPGNLDPFQVYCDMGSSGWTVIQRRQSALVDFNRSWQQYKDGFGDLGWNTNYWMGLEKLYQLTNQRTYKLKIILRAANLEYRFALYEKFRVTSEQDGYRLYVHGYDGNAGDALTAHNGATFSSPDHDTDSSSKNCAKVLKSGWWFTDCFSANLNGVYPEGYTGWPPCDAKNRCINWSTMPHYETYSLVQTEMSLIPNPQY